MNTSSQNLETQFDRLVDGELSPTEYREMLSQLDDQPDGWRRCALAFLEAQALGRELPSLMKPVKDDRPPAPVVQADRPGDWSHRTWQGLYFATVAASLALAFYVGSWTSGINSPTSGDFIAENRQTKPVGEQESIPDSRPGGAKTSKGSGNPAALAQKDAPLGNVHLVLNGTETQQGIDVPVYGQQQMDRWHTTNKPVLSPQVIEELQRSGHKVDHKQQWIRIETQDGKQVLVPVDDYQIQPPRRQAY
jgi:hypothetical protein